MEMSNLTVVTFVSHDKEIKMQVRMFKNNAKNNSDNCFLMLVK